MIKIKNVSFTFLLFLMSPMAVSALEISNKSSAEKEDVTIEDTTLYEDKMKDLDPLEPLNRGVFAVNSVLDMMLIKPLAYAYQDLVADPLKDRVSSFLNNLGAPIIFINDLLQGEGEQAANTIMRFVFNTTLGVLGLFDVASEFGLDRRGNDFETTFRRWGIGAGPYIVLPLFGSSSFRNVLGDTAEFFVDPYNLYMKNNHAQKFLGTKGGKPIYIRTAVKSLITRQQFLHITEKLDKTEDPYAQYRILYMQNRKIIDAIEESAVPDDMIEATGSSTVKMSKKN